MSLGGGMLSKNKVLPGSYINFISKSNSINRQEDRGANATPEDFVDEWENQEIFVEITNLAFDDYNTKKENLAITDKSRAISATLELVSKGFVNGKLTVGEKSKSDTAFFVKI